jgi:SAM-dependent methyltransferase
MIPAGAPSSDEILRKMGRLATYLQNVPRVLGEASRGNYTLTGIPFNWNARPERFELINAVIGEFGYQDYLEIGCRRDDCFGKIDIARRVGVDPAQGGTVKMTSDEYFATHDETFDIVFIDGLHTYEQVIRDIRNALKALRPNGTILLHDCLPTNCLAQFDFPVMPQWNGDVWKAIVEARTFGNADTATCLIDHGVGLMRKRANSNPLTIAPRDFKALKYRDLVDNYRVWLNAIEYDDALGWLKG